jgi:hypothetical protein
MRTYLVPTGPAGTLDPIDIGSRFGEHRPLVGDIVEVRINEIIEQYVIRACRWSSITRLRPLPNGYRETWEDWALFLDAEPAGTRPAHGGDR